MRYSSLILIVSSLTLSIVLNACNSGSSVPNNNLPISVNADARESGSNYTSTLKNNSLRHNLSTINDDYIPQLGSGIYALSNSLNNSAYCVQMKGETIVTGQRVAEVQLTKALSSEQLAKELNVQTNLNVNSYDNYNIGIRARYVRDIVNNNTAIGINYISKVGAERSFKSSVGDMWPDNDALDLFDISTKEKNKYADFYDSCGDSFVSRTFVGALLSVSFQLNFTSSYDKKIFEGILYGSINGKPPLANDFAAVTPAIINIALKNYNEKTHKQVSLSIHGVQFGGQALELAQVFDKQNGGIYATECSSFDLNSCNAIIQNISNYASKNFPNQIGSDYENMYTMQIKGTQYQYNGILEFEKLPTITQSKIPAATFTARENIFKLFKQVESAQILVTRYLERKDLSDNLQNELKDIYSKNKSQDYLFQDQLRDRCYGSYTNFMGDSCAKYYANDFLPAWNTNALTATQVNILNKLRSSGYINNQENSNDITLALIPTGSIGEDQYSIDEVIGNDISSSRLFMKQLSATNYSVDGQLYFKNQKYIVKGSCAQSNGNLVCSYGNTIPADLIQKMTTWYSVSQNPFI